MAVVGRVPELYAPIHKQGDMPEFFGPHNAMKYMYSGGQGERLVTRQSQRQPVAAYDDGPRDGSVVLGNAAEGGLTYTTRYFIKHPSDLRKVCVRVMHTQCVPCCIKKLQRSYCYVFWLFLRSETFLFIIHTIALVLGVVKEARDMRTEAPSAFIIQSICETIATYIVLIIRIIVTWERFTELRKWAYRVEYVDPDKDVRLPALHWWLRGILATGITFIIINAGLFITFFFAMDRRLDWTVLTNQFLLLLFLVMSALFLDRRNKMMARVREDQHKVVLYEAVLLLNETFAPQTQKDVNENYNRVKRFVQALNETPLFDPPDRIHLDRRYSQDVDDVASSVSSQSYL